MRFICTYLDERGTSPRVCYVVGFVATELVKQLLEKGYHVVGSVRKIHSSRADTLRALDAALPGKLELFEADILVSGALDKAVQGCTFVFHTA